MRADIYYFSGTGNSLFIAKELGKRLANSRLIPIVNLLNQKAIQSDSQVVGFVFPVHALTIPIAVKRFIQKTNFNSAEYLFAIATREGTIFRGFKKMDRLLKRKHKRLSSHFVINMYNNESRHEGYREPTQEDLVLIEKEALTKLDHIRDIVMNKSVSRDEDSGYLISFGDNRIKNFFLEKTVLSGMVLSEYIGGVNYFYHDSPCTGCGICEKVCLSNKIKLISGKPQWDRKAFCYMCFACLNFCPQRSVQIKDIPGVKSYSKKNGRYPHPYATVKDMIAQKEYES